MLILSQLVTACACFVGFGLLPVGTLGFLAAWIKFFIVIVCISAVGGVVGAFFLGVWIVVYMHQGMESWAMMGQAIEEGKGFLRIRLGADGALTVYSVVTEELVTDFDISPTPVMTSSGRTTKIPGPAGPLPAPRTIETPFKVLPTQTSWSAVFTSPPAPASRGCRSCWPSRRWRSLSTNSGKTRRNHPAAAARRSRPTAGCPR